MPMSVCLFVCVFVCLCVCLFVCPCFRKISKCNISAISQPIIMKLGIHITYGYTVTDKYFQNFRSKVKVVGRRKVKNVIWPYLGNEWSQRFGIGVKMQGNVPTHLVARRARSAISDCLVILYYTQIDTSDVDILRKACLKFRYIAMRI